MSGDKITVQFNGQALQVPAGTTISQLLEQAQIRSKLVAVEVNLEIVPQLEHASHNVAEGDVIEAVTLVGGG
jgi:sulfur carrier protein